MLEYLKQKLNLQMVLLKSQIKAQNKYSQIAISRENIQ